MRAGGPRRIRGTVTLAAAVVALLAIPATAGAADFTVDSLLDTPPDAPANANGCQEAGADECTFREAVEASNASQVPNCANDQVDRIFFAPSLNGQAIERTQNASIIVQSPLQIIGPGAGLLTLSGADTDDADTRRPILELNPLCGTAEVVRTREVRGLTFTGGAPAILLDNPADWILVEDSVFHDNGPWELGGGSGGGGAIYNLSGRVTVRRSTFTENQSAGLEGGGAIMNGAFGLLGGIAVATIEDSTFAGNQNSSSGGGGAISSISSRLTVARSTFHDNFGAAGALAGGGGAIRIVADEIQPDFILATTISDSTITANHDVSELGGGGIRVVPAGLGTGASTTQQPGPVTILNTVISGNTREDAAPGDASDDIRADAGGVDVFTHNLIGTTLGANLPTDLSTVIVGQDPQLGPLQDNSGPTLTRAPLSTESPLVDAGSTDALFDQRALPRPVDWPDLPNATDGDGADIGAVELQLPVVNPPDEPPAGDPPIQPAKPKKKCKKPKKKGKKKRCAKKKKRKKANR
jgi:hypothetical protein